VKRWPHSTPIVLAVCGDPVVSRALVLLLCGLHYDARFLPISSLSNLESLEGVRVLLLTSMPQLSAEHRKSLSTSLADMGDTVGVPLLELVAASVETPEGGAVDGSGYTVSWPCRSEELEQRIQSILLAHPREDGPAYRDQHTQVEKKEDGTARQMH
jgi:hypothetical protein